MNELYIVPIILIILLLNIVYFIYDVVGYFKNHYLNIISLDEMNYHNASYDIFNKISKYYYIYIADKHIISILLFISLFASIILYIYLFGIQKVINDLSPHITTIIKYIPENIFDKLKSPTFLKIYAVLSISILIYIAYFIYTICEVLFFNNYKYIYEHNNNIQGLYDYLLIDYIIYATNKENISKTDIFKIKEWGFSGDKDTIKSRVGSIDDADDMINKRLKLLITFVFCEYYIFKRTNSDMLLLSNLSKENNLDKENLFLNLPKKKDVILPTLSETKKRFRDIYTIIKGTDDEFSLNADHISKLNTKYNDIYMNLFQNIKNLKNYSSYEILIIIVIFSEIIMSIIYILFFLILLAYIIYLLTKSTNT